jgi:hypothetical protein
MPARVQLRRESNKAQGPELTELYNRIAKKKPFAKVRRTAARSVSEQIIHQGIL